MKQEDKELLLKDLCARLPYGVKINVNGEEDTLLELGVDTGWVNASYDIEEVKPYLRLMSSMTEEEREDLSHYENPVQRTDFYYSHHIDCRFMIEKGLALEAPENIYA